MSQVKVTGNASGNGTLTIAAPNTNSDYTLTLPTNTGTILTSATTTGFPAGSVIQVVHASSTTATTTATTTYTDTTLSASITPTSASSKILILISQQFYSQVSSSGSAISTQLRILRGSTDIFTNASTSYEYAANSNDGYHALGGVIFLQYLDSPNTTSATTYKTQGSVPSTGNSRTVTWQASSNPSTITLMEIAA